MMVFLLVTLVMFLLGLFIWNRIDAVGNQLAFPLRLYEKILLCLILVWPIHRIFSVYTLFVLYSIMFACLIGLIRFVSKFTKKPIRRSILYLILPFLIAAITLTGGWFHMRNVRQTEYTIESGKIRRADGYKILVLTDLHSGTEPDVLVREQERLKAVNADVVLLVGDIIDENTTVEQAQKDFTILGSLNPTYGTYFIYGNHDYGYYLPDRKQDFAFNHLESLLEQNDIKILADDMVAINPDLQIVGRHDRLQKWRAPVEELAEHSDSISYRLLADHQPREFAINKASGFDLTVSGHTHAGQIFPLRYFLEPFHFADLDYGMWQEDDFRAIVSSGIVGWNYPIRTQGISEYVVIHLKPSVALVQK